MRCTAGVIVDNDDIIAVFAAKGVVTMSYVDKVIADIEKKDAGQPEFIQAAKEVLESLRIIVDKDSIYEKAGLLERLVEPERAIVFRVPWVEDTGFNTIRQSVLIKAESVFTLRLI